VKFGSAWPGENKDNEIVSIPGLEEEPKEISLKTCQNYSCSCG
jgi:cell division protein FtsA